MNPIQGNWRRHFESLLRDILVACQRHYADRLVTVAVFGSVGRGTPRPDSDIDLLIVAEDLPRGRVRRSADFRQVEEALALPLAQARRAGLAVELSPVFKTPDEVLQGSLLFLDMIEDARLLCDRQDFMRQVLIRLRERLARLGARRIWRGNAWLWDLNPAYQPGMVFEV